MTRRWFLPAIVLVAAASAVGLVAFQPWKAFVDETVDEAAPVTASPAASPVTTVPVTTTTSAAPAATTAPPTTASVVTEPTTAATAAPTTATAPAPAPVEPTMFRSKAHGTSGTVQVLTLPDGSRVLRIEDLDTSNGPDVKVVLSPDPDGYADGAVSLGTLKGNKGSQNYEIPPDVDVRTFASVVIWCKRFDVDFGVAPLPV